METYIDYRKYSDCYKVGKASKVSLSVNPINLRSDNPGDSKMQPLLKRLQKRFFSYSRNISKSMTSLVQIWPGNMCIFVLQEQNNITITKVEKSTMQKKALSHKCELQVILKKPSRLIYYNNC